MTPDAFIAFYPASDLAATRDFYERDLGLALARDQGSCLIFRVAGGGYLGFCQHERAASAHAGVILTLVLEDVDAVYRRLQRLAVETEGPPRLNEGFGIYHFFARDPDGYRLEVQRFLEPLPPG
jgi:predicted enzyme related to lactoylglutathione lyase